MIPPTKWGRKPSLCGSPCREKTGWPVGEMIVVVVVVVVVFATLGALLGAPGALSGVLEPVLRRS